MSQHQSDHTADANPAGTAPESEETGTDWTNTGGPAAGPSAEPGGWPGGNGRWSSASAGASAQAWLAQLQSIVDNLATQSAPVVREVGAKAAEIAALAAERAGPLALRAADATAQATVRVAERSRSLAAELRRSAGEMAGHPPDESADGHAAGTGATAAGGRSSEGSGSDHSDG